MLPYAAGNLHVSLDIILYINLKEHLVVNLDINLDVNLEGQTLQLPTGCAGGDSRAPGTTTPRLGSPA